MKYILIFLILSFIPFSSVSAESFFWTENQIQNQYFTDESVTRFVSRDTSLADREYVPTGLFSIASEYIDERGRKSSLRSDANDALQLLAKDFFLHFETPLVVVSAYRDFSYQQRLWDLGRCTETLCALPGYSEHQLGLAIDIFEASTEEDFFASTFYGEYYDWLQENAYKYGWIQSYINGSEIDGYEVEPWHWRYVGVDLATHLHEIGWSFTQYVRIMTFLSQIQNLSFLRNS